MKSLRREKYAFLKIRPATCSYQYTEQKLCQGLKPSNSKREEMFKDYIRKSQNEENKKIRDDVKINVRRQISREQNRMVRAHFKNE